MNYFTRFKAVDRDLRLLWLSVFCLMFGMGVYSASFFNFVTETFHVTAKQMGWCEFFREMPGFLCVFVAALTMRVAEPLLGTIAMLVTSIGISAYAGVSSMPSLIAWSFVWSMGLHAWMPLSSSITMNLAKSGAKGARLGQTTAAGSIGTLIGMTAVLTIGHHITYQVWYIIAGIMMFAAAILMLGVRRNIGQMDKPRFVWKRGYRLYYALTFLEGCRKQVFFTFAPLVLTKVCRLPLQTMALLMVINSVVNMIGAPIIGRMIDRTGEKKILTTCYTALVFVFIGYATIPHKFAWLLGALYCLDSLFYLSTTCLTTFVEKLADKEDLMPTLSMGVTMNHAAAVTVPLIGGYLWDSLGYSITFFGGAVVVIMSIILASRVGRIKKTVNV